VKGGFKAQEEKRNNEERIRGETVAKGKNNHLLIRQSEKNH